MTHRALLFYINIGHLGVAAKEPRRVWRGGVAAKDGELAGLGAELLQDLRGGWLRGGEWLSGFAARYRMAITDKTSELLKR